MEVIATERPLAGPERRRWDWKLQGWIAAAIVGVLTALIGAALIRSAVVAYWPAVLGPQPLTLTNLSPPSNSLSSEANQGAWMLAAGFVLATIASGARLLRTRWPWLAVRSILCLVTLVVLIALLQPLLALYFAAIVARLDDPPAGVVCTSCSSSPVLPGVFQSCVDVASLALLLGVLAWFVNTIFGCIGVIRRIRAQRRAVSGLIV